MKLRIHGNSIRLRLLQSEVAQIGAGHAVVETTHFGLGNNQQFKYALVPKLNIGHITTLYESGNLEILIPIELGKRWANSEEVGLSFSEKINNSDNLEILIEKDFKCLHQENSNQTDNFPNPLAVEV
jgi:hypothetical protein